MVQYFCFDLSSFTLTLGHGPFSSAPHKHLEIYPPDCSGLFPTTPMGTATAQQGWPKGSLFPGNQGSAQPAQVLTPSIMPNQTTFPKRVQPLPFLIAVSAALSWHHASTSSVEVPPLCIYNAPRYLGQSCRPASFPLGW